MFVSFRSYLLINFLAVLGVRTHFQLATPLKCYLLAHQNLFLGHDG